MYVSTLRDILKVLLDRYVSLVNSGDCGVWNPEDEPIVQLAREALTSPIEPGPTTPPPTEAAR